MTFLEQILRKSYEHHYALYKMSLLLLLLLNQTLCQPLKCLYIISVFLFSANHGVWLTFDNARPWHCARSSGTESSDHAIPTNSACAVAATVIRVCV